MYNQLFKNNCELFKSVMFDIQIDNGNCCNFHF